MKILITGATGFLGQYVYKELLKTKHIIIALSRSAQNRDKNFYNIDILNHKNIREFVASAKPDVLIHLSWDVTHGQYWSSSSNIDYELASINLFDAFIGNGGKKILAAGTCAEYPELSTPVSEDYEENIEELSLYGQSKRRVYQYLQQQQQKIGLEFTWFRIFGIFGLGEDERRLFPDMIKSVLNNKKPLLKSPYSFCDYIWVSDLARFIVKYIDSSALGVLNIGSGKGMSIGDYYETIENYVQTGCFKVTSNFNKKESSSRIPNCQKLLKITPDFKDSFQNGIISIINDKKHLTISNKGS